MPSGKRAALVRREYSHMRSKPRVRRGSSPRLTLRSRYSMGPTRIKPRLQSADPAGPAPGGDHHISSTASSSSPDGFGRLRVARNPAHAQMFPRQCMPPQWPHFQGPVTTSSVRVRVGMGVFLASAMV